MGFFAPADVPGSDGCHNKLKTDEFKKNNVERISKYAGLTRACP